MKACSSVKDLLDRLSTETNIVEIVGDLSDLIRTDESLRQNGLPEEFYSALKDLVRQQLAKTSVTQNLAWHDLQVLIRCVKISAAAFKSSVNADELSMCHELCSFWVNCVKSLEHLSSKENGMCKCLLFSLQYFFNLSQGNPKFLEHLLVDWTNLAFRLINTQDIDYSVYEVACMLIVNSCIDKRNEHVLTDKSFSSREVIAITGKVFSNLDYVRSKSEDSFVDFDQEELEFLIDESNHNWAFRLVDYLCDSKHCLAGLLNDFAGFDLVDRINLLKVLKVKLAKSHKTKEQRSEFALDVAYVDTFMCLYIKASAFFKEYLVDLTESPEFESQRFEYSVLVHMHLSELKHMGSVLSDLLTIEQNREDKLEVAQTNEHLLSNTCHILKELYENEALKGLVDLLKENELHLSTHCNLKCELIRLIGILVYRNRQNQKLIAANKCMELIASANLDLDACNPFVREWSMIALKHVLETNDYR